jgi:hypothetical protein
VTQPLDFIQLPRGDRRVVRFQVPEELRAITDRVFFMVKKFIWMDDEDSFFSLNSVENPGRFITDLNGVYFVILTSEDTVNFPLGRHISSIRLLDVNGEVHTLGTATDVFNIPFLVEIVTQHEVGV